MNHRIAIIAILCLCGSICVSTTHPAPSTGYFDEIYAEYDIQAEFPGGQAALLKWIKANLQYPEPAKKDSVQGRVILKLVVEKDGSIKEARILKSIRKELDEEAIRLVKSMPKWKPAINRGDTVRSYFNLPITFRLPQEMNVNTF